MIVFKRTRILHYCLINESRIALKDGFLLMKRPDNFKEHIYALLLGSAFLGVCLFTPTTASIADVLSTILVLFFGAFLPGVAFYRLLFPKLGVLENFVIGTTLGTMLLACGSALSSLFNLQVLSWLPSIICLFSYLIKKKDKIKPAIPNNGSGPIAFGTMLGLAALLPALLTTLRAQRSAWTGWWTFHVDLPFQISLVSETQARIPKVYPFASDTELRYTWLTHAVLGKWGQLSRISSFEIVLQYWPIFFSIIFPLIIASLTYRLSKNLLATALAPLAAITLHGPLIGESSYLWTEALAPYTPSRDMGTLWLCLLLHLIISCEEYSATYGRTRTSQLLAVFVAAFCLAGGKGSIAPIVVGALLISGFFYLRKSDSQKLFYAVSIAIIGGFLCSQILIVKSSGRLKFDPLSFADSLPGVGTIWPIIWGLCILMPALGLLLGLRQISHLPSIALAMVFVFPLVGVIGILSLGHPGMGQLYFLSSVIPFFGISVALLLGELWKSQQRLIILLIAISYFAVQISWKSTTTFDHKYRALLIISVAICFALGGTILCQKSQFGTKKLTLSATFLLTTTTLLGPSVSNGSTFDTGASSISTNSIHSDQLHALTWLRENSDTYQMFITNKHCIVGSVLTSDCYPRWFMATAISERRSPVEGYSYTYRNLDGPYWDPELLKVLDEFIVAPTESVRENLINSDISWIYIDTNFPYSKDLANFATLKFDSEQAKIFELSR